MIGLSGKDGKTLSDLNTVLGNIKEKTENLDQDLTTFENNLTGETEGEGLGKTLAELHEELDKTKQFIERLVNRDITIDETNPTEDADAGTDTLTATGAFTGYDLEGKVVIITKGTGSGQIRRIASHDDDTVSLTRNWNVNVTTNSTFIVLESVNFKFGQVIESPHPYTTLGRLKEISDRAYEELLTQGEDKEVYNQVTLLRPGYIEGSEITITELSPVEITLDTNDKFDIWLPALGTISIQIGAGVYESGDDFVSAIITAIEGTGAEPWATIEWLGNDEGNIRFTANQNGVLHKVMIGEPNEHSALVLMGFDDWDEVTDFPADISREDVIEKISDTEYLIVETLNNMIPIEGLTEAVLTIDTDHKYIHQGAGYVVSLSDLDLPNGGIVDISFDTGNQKYIHLKDIKAIDCVIRLWENPASVVVGDTITPVNQNRQLATLNAIESTAMAYETESADLTGATLVRGWQGEYSNHNHEIVLLQDHEYIIEIENIAGAQNNAYFEMFFYEEDGYNG